MKNERPHPMVLIVFLLGISALITGCETVGVYYHGNSQPDATRPVFVFRGEMRPTSQYREVGVLSDQGGLEEQNNIEQRFVSKARRAGADALIFDPVIQSAKEPVTTALPISDQYTYKATMVTFVREFTAVR